MDCPRIDALARKDGWYMMSDLVRSDRWVLLCLHLAVHFSTLFAKSRAFGLSLQTVISDEPLPLNCTRGRYSLESVDIRFANPLAMDCCADRHMTRNSF